jgi:hypothetical protein
MMTKELAPHSDSDGPDADLDGARDHLFLADPAAR